MKKNARGFTIVELLVVIVVIAILAAITIVTYSSIRQRALNATAQSDMTNLGKALMAYRVENGRYPANDNEIRTALQAAGVLQLGTKYSYDNNNRKTFMYCLSPDSFAVIPATPVLKEEDGRETLLFRNGSSTSFTWSRSTPGDFSITRGCNQSGVDYTLARWSHGVTYEYPAG